MLLNLPNDNVLYDALMTRSAAYEGLAFVGVKSTGIFCRLTCPARKPKRVNCVFFTTVVGCIDAGFRPCLRCRPLVPVGEADPVVRKLVNALEEDPSRRWREQCIVEMGYDPSTVRRIFKRHFDITFLEMARLRRLRNGVSKLSEGSGVILAQLEAGFESASGFRSAFARILGQSPSDLKQGSGLNADWLETPLGAMLVVTDVHALYLLEFFDRKGLPRELQRLQAKRGAIGIGRYETTDQIETELNDYFGGTFTGFSSPLAQEGNVFSKNVWKELQNIPLGETRTYSDIAKILCKPTASRAVARANGANQISIVVPCHRVIGADGSLTGYGGGRWRKRWLIDHERKLSMKASNIPE